MMCRKTQAMMAALLAGCLAAGGAMAQPASQQGDGPGMMQSYGPGYSMMQGYGAGYSMMPGWDMMESHAAGMLAFLKAEIGVTPAQEPPWQKFAAALQAMAGVGHGRHGAMMADRGQAEPLPETLADRVEWMEAHLAALRQVQAAAGPFYAALDAAQRQKADALLGCPPCGR
jgi:hypothetical protein